MEKCIFLRLSCLYPTIMTNTRKLCIFKDEKTRLVN